MHVTRRISATKTVDHTLRAEFRPRFVPRCDENGQRTSQEEDRHHGVTRPETASTDPDGHYEEDGGVADEHEAEGCWRLAVDAGQEHGEDRDEDDGGPRWPRDRESTNQSDWVPHGFPNRYVPTTWYPKDVSDRRRWISGHRPRRLVGTSGVRPTSGDRRGPCTTSPATNAPGHHDPRPASGARGRTR